MEIKRKWISLKFIPIYRKIRKIHRGMKLLDSTASSLSEEGVFLGLSD
jgi:hypothetical protein